MGLETSSDLEDVWMEAGLLTDLNAGSEFSGEEFDTGDPDASDCDHCCHSGAHMAAFTVSPSSFVYYKRSSRTVFQKISYEFAGQAPPTPPPNV
jgi:hypothetical protein